MEITKTIKTSTGDYEFKGNITQDEHDLILTIGINVLLQKGAMPLIGLSEEDMSKLMLHDGPEQ